ncbi:MAG: molybdopterin molybdotransferase MoeA [Candidatus Bathyarchaeota archaeon]|nr:MAG: molybdopterin molybdotransferase MoeA [Candidatus Bathyarchaeota archaeon]
MLVTNPFVGNTVVRLKGFQKLTSTDEALQTWLNVLQVKRGEVVTVPLNEALNRVLAKDMVAKEDLPRFDKSAVDGYALRAENTMGTSQFKPVIFQITKFEEVDSKQAKQVWTGNAIPKGANAVVMIENTKRRDGELEVWVQLPLGGNVSKKGEDVKKGENVVKAGTRLNPYHLGLLAALGNGEVEVIEKPSIAILATGNELAEAGSKLSENQIFESNRIMLSAMCRELDAEPVDLGIAKDDVNDIAEKLRMALRNCDAVITTGGTSVGGVDLVPDAVNEIGKPGVVVHGMAMRPAMPTALAVLEGKPVIILSGNPVAAIIGFEVFARPLICRMQGMSKEEARPAVKAVMARKIATALGRRTFVRVRVLRKDGEFFAEPVSARGSGAISTMTRGNGFVIVPENREGVTEGEIVTAHLFGKVETVIEDV